MFRRPKAAALLVAAVLVGGPAAACAQAGDEGSLVIGEGPSAPQTSDDPASVADRAVEDVTAFWTEEYPAQYGGPFEPVAGFYPYGPDTEQPPCGFPRPVYEEIADNAFYCPSDDLIAWDEHALMPSLNEEFGSFTVAIVIAHEFGHAIQDRFVTFDRTVDLELQADCFAGAWTAHVADGASERFSPADIDLDKTVAGMIAIRDQPGTPADDLFAHGSGFDRVSAFQDGYESGVALCAEYADETEDRVTAEIAFDDSPDSDEALTGGNLHLDDRGPDDPGLLTLAENDLNDFYTQLLDELGEDFTPVDDLIIADPALDAVACDGATLSGSDLEYTAVYCRDENVVVMDGPGLVTNLNRDFGDFAVASEIARLWAVAAQIQLGVDSDRADLQADCLTGRWTAWTFPRGGDRAVESETLTMSAGDLDEGLMGFIAYGAGLGEDGRSVFERADALRTGFFEGYEACEEYGELG